MLQRKHFIALSFIGLFFLVGFTIPTFVLFCRLSINLLHAFWIQKSLSRTQILPLLLHIIPKGWDKCHSVDCEIPTATSSMLWLPVSDKNRIPRNSHFFLAEQQSGPLLRSPRLLHIGVKLTNNYHIDSFSPRNPHVKPCALTFQTSTSLCLVLPTQWQPIRRIRPQVTNEYISSFTAVSKAITAPIISTHILNVTYPFANLIGLLPSFIYNVKNRFFDI